MPGQGKPQRRQKASSDLHGVRWGGLGFRVSVMLVLLDLGRELGCSEALSLLSPPLAYRSTARTIAYDSGHTTTPGEFKQL